MQFVKERKNTYQYGKRRLVTHAIGVLTRSLQEGEIEVNQGLVYTDPV